MSTTSEPTTTPQPTRERKRRRRRTPDRHLFPVQPIKAIWASASEEERTKARTLCSEVLGYWLGHESKAQIARRLGLPPIRVWQLSQRAMTGMVAALLRPPTGRRGAMPRLSPEIHELRRKVAELEKQNALQRRLIALLRTVPGNEHRELPKEQTDAARPRKPRRPKRPAADTGNRPGVLPPTP